MTNVWQAAKAPTPNAPNAPNPSQATANTSRTHMPQLSDFKGVQGCRLPTPEHFKPLCQPFPPASERSKPSRRHFPGNCQQRLAATCPSHLFLRWFPSRRVMLHVNLPERP